MENLTKMLMDHITRYPKMQPQDAVKLIFQNEFGSAHMISDERASYLRLKEEIESVELINNEGIEDIGNGISRLYLSYVKKEEFPLDIVNKMFSRTAKEHTGNKDSFYKKLDLLEELYEKGETPFAQKELLDYLEGYKKEGCPVVSHSLKYKENYKPAYRIVDSRYIKLLPLIKEISKNLLDKQRVIVAIDGKAASGKTTAANLLSSLYKTEIIHMDDFFLPIELRTEKRLNEPGGNVHYERFKEEVISKLNNDNSFEYKKFDCSIMDYNGTASINKSKLLIIEGAYSLHPLFKKYYDISAFFEISEKQQMDRILKRNGEKMAGIFKSKWIPMENQYIEHFNIKDNCNFVINCNEV